MTQSALLTHALAAHVRAWAAADPDPRTRAEAERLLQRAEASDPDALARLRDAFDGRLSFGTAGLRAEMGVGPRRMNRLVVAQSSAGLAAYLHARDDGAGGGSAAAPSIVIGYDGRVNSETFARDAAEVFAGASIRTTLLPEPLPTPVLAFAVRHLDASAGVMITASHNPPRDNGYKVYLGGPDEGRQIVSPQDREIAAAITAELERAGLAPPRSTDYRLAGPDIADAYVAETAAALPCTRSHASTEAPGRAPGTASGLASGQAPGSAHLSDPDESAAPTVVYTALHGVGSSVAQRVFVAAGLPAVVPVARQDRPDGAFPTVAYPNPEEPGALDLAYALAEECGAPYVLANDPDADRLALAARHPESPNGYRRLNGNELGLLLGRRAAEQELLAAAREQREPTGALASTLVSSPALGALARHYGLAHAETLPGFKWVARVPGLIFGYEESIGYLTTPAVVGDKDGVSAAAEALAMLRDLHAAGRTVWQELDALSERIGLYASAQIVVRRERMAEAEALAERIRAHPPTGFGGIAVTRARDFRSPGLAPAPANLLAYDLADGSRVMIRPSGTEPKLKIYLDAFSDAGSVAERRARTSAALAAIEAAARDYLTGAEQ